MSDGKGNASSLQFAKLKTSYFAPENPQFRSYILLIAFDSIVQEGSLVGVPFLAGIKATREA